MSDLEFDELKKEIRDTKAKLNRLQDKYKKETGKRYNSFDFYTHRKNSK